MEEFLMSMTHKQMLTVGRQELKGHTFTNGTTGRKRRADVFSNEEAANKSTVADVLAKRFKQFKVPLDTLKQKWVKKLVEERRSVRQVNKERRQRNRAAAKGFFKYVCFPGAPPLSFSFKSHTRIFSQHHTYTCRCHYQVDFVVDKKQSLTTDPRFIKLGITTLPTLTSRNASPFVFECANPPNPRCLLYAALPPTPSKPRIRVPWESGANLPVTHPTIRFEMNKDFCLFAQVYDNVYYYGNTAPYDVRRIPTERIPVDADMWDTYARERHTTTLLVWAAYLKNEATATTRGSPLAHIPRVLVQLVLKFLYVH